MDFYNNDKIPYDVSKKLSKKDFPTSTQDRLNETLFLYAFAIGSLMYALMCTRPDLAYVVGVLSRFQSNLEKSHWARGKASVSLLEVYWVVCFDLSS